MKVNVCGIDILFSYFFFAMDILNKDENSHTVFALQKIIAGSVFPERLLLFSG